LITFIVCAFTKPCLIYRSTSEVLQQPQFMDHPTKVPLSPTKNIPQLPKQQLDPPALPPRRLSKLSDTRVPSSKIKLSETLEEGNYIYCFMVEAPHNHSILKCRIF